MSSSKQSNANRSETSMQNSSRSRAESPMVQVDFSRLPTAADVLSIQEYPFLGHVNLRGSLQNKQFVSAVKKVVGEALPSNNNTYANAKAGKILWLGPDEWLLICTAGEQDKLVAELKSALGDTFAAVTDVSGGNTVLELTGSKARAIIEKGCPLDLHSTQFSTGQCAQSIIAKTGFTLLQVDDSPTYQIIIRRSFSDYLGAWLLDAAREFS